MKHKTAVYRREHFNAAHRLFNPALSADENAALFGKCSYPNYHGHNYEVVLKVVGEINPVTGFVVDTKHLSDLMKEHVLEKFDHRNLNLDTNEFKTLIPTAENIAMVIHQLISPHLAPNLDLTVILYETERNYVEYPA
jgi:6-pyruvoyltetrahydropterin/6-carboxytetrahydropterin synthase